MKKFSTYYTDSKIKWNRKDGLYYYEDENGYLFSKGIYRTKTKEKDLPKYYIKLLLHSKYLYLSLKGIKDIHYKPSFYTNHWRKDDALYISYTKKLVIEDEGHCYNRDVVISGPEIDHFINELEKYDYNKRKIKEIKDLMNKKTKWYKYWDERNGAGDYHRISDEVWKEILGEGQ